MKKKWERRFVVHRRGRKERQNCSSLAKKKKPETYCHQEWKKKWKQSCFYLLLNYYSIYYLPYLTLPPAPKREGKRKGKYFFLCAKLVCWGEKKNLPSFPPLSQAFSFRKKPTGGRQKCCLLKITYILSLPPSILFPTISKAFLYISSSRYPAPPSPSPSSAKDSS